jgi:predicted nucleic acid-binding protein
VTRVVADSNVYISALVFGGVPRQVLDLLYGERFALYISKSIMDEGAGTLREKFNWSRQDIQTFLRPYGNAAPGAQAGHPTLGLPRPG